MMQSEFEKITGIYLPSTMYDILEKAYMECDLDKQEFCQKYCTDAEGLASKIQKQTDSRLYKQEEDQARELKEAREQIKKLQEALEKEEEWVLYPNKTLFDDYGSMHMDCDIMSEEEAKKFIALTFGFQSDAIHILTEYPQQEINRHHQIRKAKHFPPLSRRPLYGSTDYNYIMFSVCGNTYECVDGELYIVDD